MGVQEGAVSVPSSLPCAQPFVSLSHCYFLLFRTGLFLEYYYKRIEFGVTDSIHSPNAIKYTEALYWMLSELLLLWASLVSLHVHLFFRQPVTHANFFRGPMKLEGQIFKPPPRTNFHTEYILISCHTTRTIDPIHKLYITRRFFVSSSMYGWFFVSVLRRRGRDEHTREILSIILGGLKQRYQRSSVSRSRKELYQFFLHIVLMCTN